MSEVAQEIAEQTEVHDDVLNEIHQDITASDELATASTALESLITTISGFKEMDPNHYALYQQNMSLVLSNIDVKYKQKTISVESYKQPEEKVRLLRISMEESQGWFRRTIKAIIEFFKRIVRKIMSWFSKVGDRGRKLHAYATDINRESYNIRTDGSSVKKKIEPPDDVISHVIHGHSVPNDMRDHIHSLERLTEKIAKGSSIVDITNFKGLLDLLHDFIDKSIKTKHSGTVYDIESNFHDLLTEKISPLYRKETQTIINALSLRKSDTNRDAPEWMETYANQPMLGDMSIVLQKAIDNPYLVDRNDGEGFKITASIFRNTLLTLQPTTVSAGINSVKNAGIEVDLSTITSCSANIIKIADTLMTFSEHTTVYFNTISKTIEDKLSVIDKLFDKEIEMIYKDGNTGLGDRISSLIAVVNAVPKLYLSLMSFVARWVNYVTKTCNSVLWCYDLAMRA